MPRLFASRRRAAAVLSSRAWTTRGVVRQRVDRPACRKEGGMEAAPQPPGRSRMRAAGGGALRAVLGGR